MVFNKERKLFACIDAVLEEEDKDDLTADFIKTIQDINKIIDFKSINELISQEAKQGFKSKKCTYKVNNGSILQDLEFSGNEYQRGEAAQSVETMFYTIKVKQQTYLGKPAIAIYINEVTKNIMEKIHLLKRQEQY